MVQILLSIIIGFLSISWDSLQRLLKFTCPGKKSVRLPAMATVWNQTWLRPELAGTYHGYHNYQIIIKRYYHAQYIRVNI